jgi:hypothetical protein
VYRIEDEMTTVYCVYRNADMTEGRGPMLLDSIWASKELAEDYMDCQQGVMGRQERWSKSKSHDWEVREFSVHSEKHYPIRIVRERALAKLSVEEKEALGL